MSIGQELLDVPFAEMVAQLAGAIAEGQMKLDTVSCKIAQMMGDAEKHPISLPDVTNDNKPIVTSLIGAGFQPAFYQFTDTIIEVKIDIKITKESQTSVNASTTAKTPFGCVSTTVNAGYSSKYSYSAEGSSLLRTKITPMPPSVFMQKLLDMKAQKIQQEFELLLKKQELEILKEQKKIDKELEQAEKEANEQTATEAA